MPTSANCPKNPSDVRADVGIRAPILPLSQQPLASQTEGMGLRKEGEIGSETTNGTRRRAVYQAARLELMRRHGFSTNPERSAFDLWPSDLGLNPNPGN